MKKIIACAVMMLALVLTLASCGKFTCDLCEEEKTGKQYKYEVLGEEGICCEDCHEELEELKDALN